MCEAVELTQTMRMVPRFAFCKNPPGLEEQPDTSRQLCCMHIPRDVGPLGLVRQPKAAEAAPLIIIIIS